MAAEISTGRLNPFPGLRPFREDEAHLFFGRERQVTELLHRLESSRFVAVVGTSGSGKSSLIFAGLLPALHAGAMASVAAWRVALMRPGSDPMRELARALSDEDALGADIDAEAVLAASSFGLIEVTRRAGLASDECLLVVVDQFEEIFRFRREQAGGADRAASFVELLLRASADQDTPVAVLLTMRSDFLGDCAKFRDLPEAINESQFLVPRMRRDERRDAIEGPMIVRGNQIAPRLVERLLNDAGDDPNQLPVLQHALMRTVEVWLESGEKRPADLNDYEDPRIGSMKEALNKHANQVLDEMKGVPRPVAIRMFQRLTDRRAGARDTRRPTTAGELCEVTGADLETV